MDIVHDGEIIGMMYTSTAEDLQSRGVGKIVASGFRFNKKEDYDKWVLGFI